MCLYNGVRKKKQSFMCCRKHEKEEWIYEWMNECMNDDKCKCRIGLKPIESA